MLQGYLARHTHPWTELVSPIALGLDKIYICVRKSPVVGCNRLQQRPLVLAVPADL
jgi:hypothetical protein